MFRIRQTYFTTQGTFIHHKDDERIMKQKIRGKQDELSDEFKRNLKSDEIEKYLNNNYN